MDSPSPRKRTGVVIAVLIVVLLPILYVLSIGPAAVLFQDAGPRAKDAFTVFYYPVIWLHENTPLRAPLEAYVEFWIELS